MQSIESLGLRGTRRPAAPAVVPVPPPAARSAEPAPEKKKLAKKGARSAARRPAMPKLGGWERRMDDYQNRRYGRFPSGAVRNPGSW